MISTTTHPVPLAETFEELVDLSPEALLTLYSLAYAPSPQALVGNLDGRALDFPIAKRPLLRRLLRRYSVARKFIWKGKVCHMIDADYGEGFNILEGNRQKYRFRFSLGNSLKDNKPAIIFDYKAGGNPGLIQKLQGEVREVVPGVWIGLEYLLWGSKQKLLSIFALTNQDMGDYKRYVAPVFPKLNKLLKALTLILPLGAILWFVVNLRLNKIQQR